MTEPVTRVSPSNAVTVKSTRRRFSPNVWFAWGLAIFAVVVSIWSIIVSLPLWQAEAGPMQILSDILFQSFIIAFAVPAALIIARQPRNTVGWLLALPVLGGALTLLSEYLLLNVPPPASPDIVASPSLYVALLLDNIPWTLFIFPILLLPVLFPTGRPPTRRWYWVVAYGVGLLLAFYVLAIGTPNIGPTDGNWTVRSPTGFLPQEFIDVIFGPIWAVALILLALAPVAALIVRYRRGSKVEQAQIKWVLYASTFFGISYIAFLALGNSTNPFLTAFVNIVFPFMLFAVPISIGIAILHYRLWDIDFVINRSLVYGALTILLVALFGLSLIVVQLLFQNLTGGPIIAVAVAAAGFGGLFQPARRRLQRFVDQRFYHINIDYNKTPAPVVVSTTAVLKHTHFGAYQNLELIGQGGMAEVYKSTHPTLNLPVAIKILPAQLATDSDFRRRFAREAQTVAKLEHPHIIRIFDHGELNGTHYMVMEYIVGKDLGEYINQHGRLKLNEALPIFKGFASALDYAHGQGIVHRDIKPSNLLLDTSQAGPQASPANYRAVLTDFGIAKILSGVTRYTTTGGIVGTLDYIAPEQIQAAAEVDGRADVYAAGAMVYQTLTGVLPFQHQNAGALLMAHMLQPAPDARLLAPDLPQAAADAIQRAMAKKPEQRFATAGEFIAALAGNA